MSNDFYEAVDILRDSTETQYKLPEVYFELWVMQT